VGDLLQRADDLDARIARSAVVQEAARTARRNTVFLRILGVSVALDILLSATVGYVAWKANATAEQANSIQSRQRNACLAGNTTRAGQQQLWHAYLAIPPSTPRTPAEQRQIDQFRVYVDHLFAPQTCAPLP
jgi:hypothetical protein